MKTKINALIVCCTILLLICGCESKNTKEQQYDNGTLEDQLVEIDVNGKEKINGIRSSFKDAMDSYEEFFNEYVDFMNKYINADSEDMLRMMGDYADYMNQYSETMKKLEELDTEELSNEEVIYYTQVMSRITQKLLEIE